MSEREGKERVHQVRACVYGLGSGIITSISSFGYGRSSTLPTTLPRAGVTHASPETSMGGGGGGEAGSGGGDIDVFLPASLVAISDD